MKQFLVFVGGDYYPGGGWDDFAFSFDNFDSARDYAQGALMHNDWAQVVDTHTGVMTYFDKRRLGGRNGTTYPLKTIEP